MQRLCTVGGGFGGRAGFEPAPRGDAEVREEGIGEGIGFRGAEGSGRKSKPEITEEAEVRGCGRALARGGAVKPVSLRENSASPRLRSKLVTRPNLSARSRPRARTSASSVISGLDFSFYRPLCKSGPRLTLEFLRENSASPRLRVELVSRPLMKAIL